MKNFALSILGIGVIAATIQAGPFRRKAVAVACVNGNCPAPTQQSAQTKGGTATAKDAALLIVETGRFRHWGHPAGLFEGIGMASTPQGAIQSCCFWGRRQPVDIATARMSNGMYVAVVRYR